MKKEILRPQSRFSMNSRIGATVPAANIWIGRIPRAQCLIRHPDQIQFHNWNAWARKICAMRKKVCAAIAQLAVHVPDKGEFSALVC
jgi:hypothetical protein